MRTKTYRSKREEVLRAILQLMIAGFWQGVGVEFSFFVLWIGWRMLHRQLATKFDPEHFFHVIHDYFMK